ncbi:MAG: VOC family protein [Cyclobacteriaceae bacterium]|nr:VOC family protein [Cyclobacteriaceae bacterium]
MKNIITPCLWFDTEAEEAADLYTSIFKNSKIDHISRYNMEGKEVHGKDSGTVMTVNFTINGQPFVALNGGPIFQFNEAVSFQIFCDTQEEIDHYWNSLTSNGGQESQCGWLKDKYGVSWQVIPSMLGELMSVPDKAEKVTKTFLQMRKIDINALEQAGR